MNSLPLSQLPSLRNSEKSFLSEHDDFVDEEVVRAIVAGTYISRVAPAQGDLALSAEEPVFSGWPHVPADFPREMPEVKWPDASNSEPEHPTNPSFNPPRRAAPPTLEFASLKPPGPAVHRWWLAAIAGCCTAAGIAALLFSNFKDAAPSLDPLNTPVLKTPPPILPDADATGISESSSR